ncbi:hypothetical protein GCM10028801_44750 [Nocardioides maradonensis]
MSAKRTDYDEWADQFGSEDYELPAGARAVRGTPEGHEAMRAMLLEAAETPEEQEVLRNLGGRPTLAADGGPSVPWRLRVPKSLDAQFGAVVEHEGRSFSEVMRSAAEEYIKAHAPAR